MSIGRSQAAAIADGFLDEIGSGDVGDLVLKETLTEFYLLAGELAEDASNNLIAGNNIASGKLAESITVEEPVVNGTTITVDVLMNFYGKFVNSGVKGTKSGAGLYSFKTSFPNKKMATALLAGIKSAKGKMANTNKKKTISGHERKTASISELDKAYAIATSIKMHGIKATGFMDRAILTAQNKLDKRLGDALEVDILNSLIN